VAISNINQELVFSKNHERRLKPAATKKYSN
jgi:hypothetical protein